MRGKNLIIGTFLCGMLLLTGCGDKDASAGLTEKEGTAVEVSTVALGEIATENRINGRVVSENEVSIYSPISAEVTSVNVKVGDKVSTNTVLFTVDNESLMRNYQALVADYDRTKALYDQQIALAEKSLEDTKTIYNEQVRQAEVSARNIHALYEVGAATSIEVDNVDFALEQARIGADSAIKQAEITLTSTKNGAESALTSMKNGISDSWDVIDKTYGKSTINGTVTAVNIKKGVMTSPQVASVVVSNSDKQQVLVSVSETLKPLLKAGYSVDVVISAIGSEKINGVIDSVSPSPNAMTSLYDVYINLPEDTLSTSLGMFAEVTFRTNRKENAVVIPTQAILTDGETQYVFVTEDENTAKKVVIETGLVGKDTTEVTGGLKEGDQLIIKGQSYLTDTASLRIVGRV
ncbi:MAG: efflux RND transporter periplasmic adaptor subunit [Clostridia bacterium]|nr:efflux RND transporter periplasmic adaptor subunit [Clostridia bacterium]